MFSALQLRGCRDFLLMQKHEPVCRTGVWGPWRASGSVLKWQGGKYSKGILILDFVQFKYKYIV